MKQILQSLEARKDIEEIVRYYSKQNLRVTTQFINEYKIAVSKIEKMPAIGSLRFADELDILNVRAYSLSNFPYLVFYFEQHDHIDLVRVLHTHRDIFNLLLGLD